MTELIVQAIVPILAVVVLASLVATSPSRGGCSFGGRALATAGVVVGGPMAMLMLGSLAARADEASSQPTDSQQSKTEQPEAKPSATSETASELQTPPSDSTESTPPKATNPQPTTTIIYPEDRPDWVESPPQRQGEPHRNFVSSGPHSQRLDCLRSLNEELLASARAYIEEYLGEEDAWRHLPLDLQMINSRLLDPEYVYGGKITTDLGTMHEEHRALRFDSDFRQQLDRQWTVVKEQLAAEEKRRTMQSRLFLTLLAGGGVLGLLATICGYFRIDNATRGFYTGRLQFAALAAILAIVAAGVMAARWIPWR